VNEYTSFLLTAATVPLIPRPTLASKRSPTGAIFAAVAVLGQMVFVARLHDWEAPARRVGVHDDR
jgi:hypothetical protein